MNAVKYTQNGGKVNITASREKDHYIFCVSDNGKGIDKPYILDLFKQRIREKSDMPAEINGLGLILCKEFVEQIGGEIWLETEKNKGSSFYFTIPSSY